jgi:adenine-specific DNA-methyltransferase
LKPDPTWEAQLAQLRCSGRPGARRPAVRADLAEASAALLARAWAVRLAEARGLKPLEDEGARRLARHLPDLPYASFPPEVLGEVYQQRLSEERRRCAGIHYTPREVADYLVGRTWSEGDLLDPACGSGAFLLSAARARGQDLAALERVRGIELDPDAAALAIEALALLTSAAGIEVARAFWRERIAVGDALRARLAPVDAVVGNPPFHRATGQPELQRLARERFPEVYSGRNDVSHFFVALALETLRPQGRLGLVLPAYFLENTFARGLRELLDEQTGEMEILDLSNASIFGARVHALLLVAQKSGPRLRRRLLAPREAGRADVFSDLKRLSCGEPPRLLRQAREAPERLLDRLAAHARLDSLCRIEKGCESGCNRVFVVSVEQARALGLESAALRPLVKGRHVAPFRITASGKLLIFLDGRTPLEAYPRVQEYLLPFRETLSRRAECREGVYPWWRLHRPRGEHLSQAGVKLAVPYRAAEPAFAVDRQGALNDGGDVRFLVPGPGVVPDFLCAVLNSAVVRLWLEWRGKRKGALFEFFLEPLARIPVPGTTPEEARRIADLARRLASNQGSREEIEERVAALYGVDRTELAQASGQ